MGEKSDQARQVVPKVLGPGEIPQLLRDWAVFMRNREEAAFLSLRTREGTYVAVAGGLRNSGGHQVKLLGHPVQENGAWQLRIRVDPPTGMATMALTNPVGFFLLPGAAEEVSVRLEGAREPVEQRPSVYTSWIGGSTLHVEGAAAPFPELRLSAEANGQVLAAADVPVKGGQYAADLPIPDGPRALSVTLSAAGSEGCAVLRRIHISH